MSSKINICEIITGHFDTLRDTGDNLSKTDIVTFILLPFVIGIISIFNSFNLDASLSSLLVNFGSILTALLLSVLMLVYEQESKLDSADKDKITVLKRKLLKELYYNISFSIICSLSLVFMCFLHSVALGTIWKFNIKEHLLEIPIDTWFLTPLIVIVAVNLVLNMLMIVKRMHTLLTAIPR
ncbi:hypothetical protein [Nitrosomonas ureae]|uniref:Uncharacterized protein n=1 Tax=Nitrosomonas ureae TaxID=44577 RepID=A0A2T5IST5_9PROT|nr:hypothetical protein [Nitrosomonas ureae]PTQ86900.1 hypothetical protein C8R28_100895 [Nitrosomonas ureae]